MNITDQNIKIENCLNEALGLLTSSIKLVDNLYAYQIQADKDYKTLEYAYKELLVAYDRSKA